MMTQTIETMGIVEIILKVDACLKELRRLEHAAIDESGFNESANSNLSDPEALKEALSLLADETVSATRLTISELTEVRLWLGAVLKSIGDGGVQ